MSGSTEFDPNRVAAEFLQNLLKDTGKLLTSPAREFFKKIGDALHKNFKPYLEKTIERCSTVKTLIINHEGPSKLFDVYVHTRLKVKGKEMDDDAFIRELMNLRSVVIEGGGGSGKSMLMRYLFISLCNGFVGKIPLLVELRTLNTFTTKDLLALIYHSLTGPSGAVLTRDQFDNGLKSGSFCVILDGFDEVDIDQRIDIERQILALRENYPDLVLIVSSRPDPDKRLHSWLKFNVCRVLPMTRAQVNELIQKLDYDSKIKKKFLKALDALFLTHESFLSNPLLCIMMLITFEQYGHIPDKRHIFYEHAFDALFFRHDAAKEGGYQRKTAVTLPVDEFRDCLSAFCLVSYSKERFSFTNSEVHETIKQALQIERKQVDADDFLKDLVESICLLQVEGLQYEFTHRSFQEYFAANFIARSPTNLQTMLDVFSRRDLDEVIPMAFAMNKRLIEREWVIPKLLQFENVAKNLDPRSDLIGYVNSVFGGIELNYTTGGAECQFTYIDVHPLGAAMLQVRRLYRADYGSYKLSKDMLEIKAALNEMADRNDPRVSKTSKDRVRGGSVRLMPADEWVKKTNLPLFFYEQKTVSMKLLKEIRTSATDQQSALEGLF